MISKSILFGSTSLKVSVLLDANSWKVCSIIVWCPEKYVVFLVVSSCSVSNVWYELWKRLYSCLIVTFSMCEYCFIWTLRKWAVSFGSNSRKLSKWFDKKSEKLFAIIGSNCLKRWILFYFFLVKCFITVCFRFSCMYFWPLGWLWLKNSFVYIWISRIFRISF